VIAEAVTFTPLPTPAEAGVKVVVVIFESKNGPLVKDISSKLQVV
jgi:hypothetical protein